MTSERSPATHSSNALRLTYFVEAADRGSISAAARSLGISQPSLSTALRKLEEDVELQLFERLGNGVRLTRAGHMLLARARAVTGAMEAFDSSANAARIIQASVVSVAVPSGVNASLFPSLASAFTTRFPQHQISVVPTWTLEDTLQAVRSGAAELAMLPRVAPPQDMVGHGVGFYEFGLAVPPGAVLPLSKVVPASLDGLPLIGSRPGTIADRLVRAAREHGAQPRIVMIEPNMSALPALVAAGVGSAIVTLGQKKEVQRLGGRVIEFAPAERWYVNMVHLRGSLSEAARSFIAIAGRSAPNFETDVHASRRI